MQTFGLPRQITRGAALASRLRDAERSEAARRRDAVRRWQGARRQGLSAADAAAAVGVSRATLYRWAKRAEPRSRRPRRPRRRRGRPLDPARRTNIFSLASARRCRPLRGSQAKGARPMEGAVPPMNWTDSKTRELRRLWTEGWPTAEIGRALGVTKNAVVGKSHRLGLKPRPSPIASRSTGNAVGARAMSRSKPQEPRRISDVIDLMAGMCRWPSGDPGEADFHFCGRPAAAGKPYCAEHCAVAYVSRSRDRERSAV